MSFIGLILAVVSYFLQILLATAKEMHTTPSCSGYEKISAFNAYQTMNAARRYEVSKNNGLYNVSDVPLTRDMNCYCISKCFYGIAFWNAFDTKGFT